MAKRIGDRPLTNAEKQARFKAKKRAEGLKRNYAWTSLDFEKPNKPNDQWQGELWKELKEQELKSAKKTVKNSILNKYYTQGIVRGILMTCDFMIRRQRPDIARAILKEHYIDRIRCEEADIDKMTLAPLEKAGVFDD
jgi:hypothetical protein